MDERPLYTGLLVLFPVSVLEWVYYTYLVWPFFVSKRASLGRFHFIVCSAYVSATVAAMATRPFELAMLSGQGGGISLIVCPFVYIFYSALLFECTLLLFCYVDV